MEESRKCAEMREDMLEFDVRRGEGEKEEGGGVRKESGTGCRRSHQDSFQLSCEEAELESGAGSSSISEGAKSRESLWDASGVREDGGAVEAVEMSEGREVGRAWIERESIELDDGEIELTKVLELGEIADIDRAVPQDQSSHSWSAL